MLLSPAAQAADRWTKFVEHWDRSGPEVAFPKLSALATVAIRRFREEGLDAKLKETLGNSPNFAMAFRGGTHFVHVAEDRFPDARRPVRENDLFPFSLVLSSGHSNTGQLKLPIAPNDGICRQRSLANP